MRKMHIITYKLISVQFIDILLVYTLAPISYCNSPLNRWPQHLKSPPPPTHWVLTVSQALLIAIYLLQQTVCSRVD